MARRVRGWVPGVVSQKGRGSYARGAAALGQTRVNSAHSLAVREVPGRAERRRRLRWRLTGGHMLLGWDFSTFPQLLELRTTILEPDFYLKKQRQLSISSKIVHLVELLLDNLNHILQNTIFFNITSVHMVIISNFVTVLITVCYQIKGRE